MYVKDFNRDKESKVLHSGIPSNTAHSLCICHRTRVDFSYQNTFETLQAFYRELAATQIHHSKTHDEILVHEIAQMF